MSSGSPRSGNGISIESKSRGSTVRGKIARASSRMRLDRVADREVREREHRHAGVPGERGRLGGGRVAGLGRPVVLLLGERRLVQQQVGLVAGDLERLAGRGVARDHDLAPRARGPEHLLGANAPDDLAPLQSPELGSLDHAERGRAPRSNSPGRSSS